MKSIIITLGIMSVNIFFTISSIIGYEYLGSSDSKVYIIYCLIIALLNLILFSKDLLKKKFKLVYSDLILLSIPFINIFNFLFIMMINGSVSIYAKQAITYFLLWPSVTILIAIYINRNNLFENMSKWFEVLMLLFTLSVITSIFVPFIKGVRFESLGGATYQTASYLSAFAYGLNLYYMFYGENHERFNFTQHKFYKLICLFLCVIQLSGIFLSGGRGGIVLAAINTAYIVISVLSSRHRKSVIKIIKLILIGSVLILIFLPILLKNDIFLGGFRRVFEFISPNGGINWSGTSNRDLVYLEAMNIIRKKPILGYGIYGVEGYPHNIILEILMHGGVLYLTVWVTIFISFVNKLRKIIRKNKQYRIVWIIFLYPATMLLFSGSYLNVSEFWFSLILIFSYKGIAIEKIKGELT